MPPMIAAAQPTPAFTMIAPAAQLRAHAPHSMHADRSTIRDLPPLISKTACGQTSMHCRQPVHFAWSSERVSPFFK
jgi:hypothetical protein